jgi:quercetin dioxygenase-like cupin family protein
MRFLIAGVRAGQSCIIESIDCLLQGEQAAGKQLFEISPAEVQPRAAGKGRFEDMNLPPGSIRWLRAYFPPHQDWYVHHTDTLDFVNVMAGSLALVLDDGPHELRAGDSVLVRGVDHGWRTGADSCTISGLMLGTPAP